ncbi:MAG TPA: hypothetical protein VFH43_12225 [Candidatus Kapabacteria bacterium]|nr:hypothetical protein [Candidatus Kapabacteria bacterium]
MKHRLITLALFSVGLVAFVTGVIRGHAHNYDMFGNYTDPSTGVIYSEQSTELLQLGGIVLLVLAGIRLTRMVLYGKEGA